MNPNADLQTQLQTAQDLIEGLVNQRSAAQNESLQLNAQLKALQRQIAEKDKRIQELESRLAVIEGEKKDAVAEAQIIPPHANGAAAGATA